MFSTNTIKVDEILSDFFKGMIIRFFYRRNPSLPYVSTATSRVSTLLHLFYLSPFRCVKNPQGFLHEVLCFRFFCARFRRATYNCTPCATKSNTPNDFISPHLGSAEKHRPIIIHFLKLKRTVEKLVFQQSSFYAIKFACCFRAIIPHAATADAHSVRLPSSAR